MTPAALGEALGRLIEPSRVLTRPIDLVAWASDASVYRLMPRTVVLAASIDEIRRLFTFSHEHRIPLTFRAAGTSLSGQAVSDGILVEVARHWRTIEVMEGGCRVRVGPGAIGAAVNRALKPQGAKIGPDPASINACTMGGILANNSSGMCCGVTQNAYHTLDSLVFVLPSGTTIDTSREEADQLLRRQEPDLYSGLLSLRRDLLANAALCDRIRAKYRMKNTMGYSLNAILDFDRPVHMLRHLLVGSEGTLAFIAEAVLRTVPDCPVKYTGLLLFAGIRDACAAIEPLRDAGASAVEVMDRAALRSVERQAGVPAAIRGLPDGAAGLLVEFQAMAEAARADLEQAAAGALARLRLLAPPLFTHDGTEQASLWRVRQGMFPSVGAVRAAGTAVIIEDVAFPVPRLADAVTDLTGLFGLHGFAEAIIFGHAKDGNLHFVLTPSLNDRTAVDRYAAFMDDLVRLVTVRYDGALKAEHGTGRNMAPFVEAEWGPAAIDIMRRLQSLVDPHRLLNPGVILNEDRRAHVANLKSLPVVEPEVDKCIECGYCESICPSRQLTLTPRQRIVVRREMARLSEAADHADLLRALEADFPYDALDTCAVDGLCATSCPVSIDTGQLTKRLRALCHPRWAHSVARLAVRHFSTIESGLRLALGAARLFERSVVPRVAAAATRATGRLLGVRVPQWLPPMPRAAGPLPPTTGPQRAEVVYLPSCLSRTMGTLPGESEQPTLPATLVALSERAGVPVWIPPDTAGCCCGVPFSSKGYRDAHAAMVLRTFDRIWEWTDGGRLPVLVDTSPCAYGLRTCRELLPEDRRAHHDNVRVLDVVEFAADILLPRLAPRRLASRVVLHPVCSVTKMGLDGALERLARACAREVVVPAGAGCCGFAGDRGWLVPELTASATALEAAGVRAANADGHYSSGRTCEIGLTRATGRTYRSIVFLLDWATRE